MDNQLHRVLIVDDEDSFRLVCMEILRVTGRYEVTGCASGEEAINTLSNERFDAVVLDYILTGMSGLNVLQWMHEQKLDTPVVLITGAGTESLAVEAMKFGAYDYIPKQLFDKNHFPIVIQSVVERHSFKIEREQRDLIERDREKIHHSMKTLLDAVSSLQQTVGNTLALIAATLEERRQELETVVPLEQRDFVSRICADMKHQFDVLALASKALASLSTVAMQKIQEAPSPLVKVEDLQQTVDLLREASNSLNKAMGED